MKKSRACFADGGQISKADQLIAEMNAKYGVSGNSPAPAPVAQQPAPQPQQAPKPQSNGLVGDAMNLFGNRQKQIDKASGYANGGLIEGIGTPTSDSIPAKVQETGEDIAVSTKERIVSHEQDKLLQRLAKAMGFESVDAFFEAGTGKPVGPTIKGGKKAAYLGKKPEETIETLTNGPYTGDGASIIGDFKNWQANKISDTNAKIDSAKIGAPNVGAQQQSAPAIPLSAGALSSHPFSPEKERFPLPAGAGNFITGKDGAMPDSSGGGFTQGGKSYNVNQVGQDGDKAINRVTAPETSPLYTNIDPQKAVVGLKDQMIGGDAASVNEGLARYAKANAIRQSMIDAQPTGGIAVLPDYAAQQSNPMMDKFNSLAADAKRSGVGGQRILAEFGSLMRQQMGNDASRYGADVSAQRAAGHDQVLMRGQDLNAQNELTRLQGNPLDNQTKQLSLTQAQQIGKLQDAVLNGKTPEEQAAAAAKIRALSGKQDREDRTVKPMEIADPNDPTGQRKILVRPNDDGTYTPMKPKVVPIDEYQAAITAAKGDPAKIKLIQERARQNGVIQ